MELEEFSNKESLTGSDLSQIALLTSDGQKMREYSTQARGSFEKLSQQLLEVVNSKESSLKNKTAALASLSNFAKCKGVRDHMQNILKRLDADFEKTLKEKEQGSEAYGTQMPKLHSTMLVFIMRLFNYEVSTEEVLEYTSGKLAFAIDVLICILKVPTYELQLILNCTQVLYGLTKKTKDEAAKAYQSRIEILLEAVLRTNIIGICSNALLRQLQVCHAKVKTMTVPSALHRSMMLLYKTNKNLYTFSTQGRMATTLRQGLLISTSLISVAIPTFVQLCTDEILFCFEKETGKELHPPSETCLKSVVNSLKIAAFASFHMGTHSQALRKQNLMTVRILLLPVSYLRGHLDVVCALLCYNINVDSLSGDLHISPDDLEQIPERCRSPALIKVVSKLLAMLTTDDCKKISSEVASIGGYIPLARDTTSYEILMELLEGSSTEGRDGKISTDAPIPSAALSPNNASLEADLLKIDKQMQQLEASPPEGGTLPEHSSLRLLGDLPALAPPMMSNPSSPVSVGPMNEATNLIDTCTVPRSTTLRPGADPPPPSTLQTDAEDIPAEFTCAINGHLLKQAVRAPSGHVFEKETIDIWMAKVGHTNPLNGEPLSPSDLKPDEELVARILEWQIKQVDKENATNDDDDLYNF